MEMMHLPKSIVEIIHLLNQSGYECFVVGGAIRNHFLNVEINDYDLTTNATPEEMLQLFKDYQTLTYGRKHGTIVVVIKGETIEITTYRKEQDYLDHRHPSTVSFTTNLTDDLSRRDFTINAIAYHPSNGYIDPFHGLNDIEKRLLKTVGNPYERFNEDALRILRAIRFQARFNLDLDQETYDAMVKLAPSLDYLSAERIQHEFEGILTSKYAGQSLYTNSKVLSNWKKDCFKLDGFNKFLFHQQKLMEEKDVSFSLVLALFAKDVLNEPTDFLANTLKCTKKQTKTVEACLSFPLIDLQDLFACKKAKYMLQDEFLQVLLFQTILNNKDLNTAYEINQKLENAVTSISDLSINGHDLLCLGVQGKQIQTFLEACLFEVMKDHLSNDKSILLDYVKKELKL